MKYRLINFSSVWGLVLLLTFAMSSCSSDDDPSSDTHTYTLRVLEGSYNYTNDSELVSAIDQILAYYVRSNGHFQATATDAYTTWSKACDSIQNRDWAAEDYEVRDSTSLSLGLISVSDASDGNTVVNRRTVTLPYYVYKFQTTNESANFGLNILATLEVDRILNSFNDSGKETFFLKRSDALERFDDACDSISSHNWKQNSWAIQSGTSFTLQLICGESEELYSPYSCAEQVITLPHY